MDHGDSQPHIGVITPLFASSAPDAAPVGAVILRSDAGQFLYPLVQSWPTPSKSAETLLVRRDGDSVLFLNDLRYQPGAALTLRIPLTQTDVAAVKAVLGTEGLVEGKDYRGVEVLAVLYAIPDSTWYVVSKVDKAEVLAEWHTRSALILALIVGLAVLVGIIGAATWQGTQREHYRKLFEAEKARRESEARYHTVLLSIGDGLITIDAEGRVELLNPIAEALTGWSADEARGKPLEEVFRIINEETRQAVANPVRQVLSEGIVVGLANHTLLIARDGREIPIADSGAPVLNPDSSLSGAVLVFRDQTEERAAQKALRESEVRYRSLFENNHAVMLVSDPATGAIVDANPAACAYYGRTREEMTQMRIHQISTLTAEELEENLEGVRTRERNHVFLRQRLANGTIRNVEVFSGPIEFQGKELLYSIVHDITDRVQAEEQIRLNESRLQSLLRISQHEADTIQDLLDFVLNEAVALMESEIGYIYHYREEEQLFILNTWSKEVMNQCSVLEPQTIYELDKTGIWGEVVRQRKPIVVNDFQAPNPLKKGYPEGHVDLRKYMSVPVFRENQIVAVVGVANKQTDYTQTDVWQLSLLMDSVWKIVDRKRAEEAVRKSEAYIRSILDNLPIGVAVNSVDPTVTFSYMNDNFAKYYRTTKEAMAEPDAFWEAAYQDADFREVIKKRVREGVASGDPQRMRWEDVPITREGEETTFISAMDAPIQGTALMLSVVWDTTDRKRAEEALRESERFARSTVNSLTAHIAILDETGTIVAVNNSWRAFAEANPPLTTDVCEGANYLAVCDQATGPSSEGAAEFAAGIRAVLSGELEQFTMEYPCHSPTEQRWFVGHVSRFSGEGPVRVVVAHENITPLKLAERKRDEEHNLLRTVIDNLPDRIYAKDTEGRFLLKNLVDTNQMGELSPEETIGKTDFDYYPPEVAEQYHADDLAVIESGRPLINREEPFVSADGIQGWMLTSKVPVQDRQGKVIGLVGIGRDITVRKRAEEAEYEQRMLAEALRDAAAALIVAADLDTVMYTILENVARVVPHDASNIMLIKEGYAQPVYWRGYGPEKTPSIQELRFPLPLTQNLQQMLTTRSPFLVSHTEKYPGWVHLPLTEWVKSYVSVPIQSHGDVIGFLNLDSGTPGFFNESHVERLRAFANLVTLAIEQAQLYEQIQRHAAELELRVAERTAELNHAKERTEAILNSSSDVMILVRTDGTISQVNPAFERVFGCDPDEALSQPFTMLVVPEQVSLVEGAFATVADTRQPERLEVTVKHHTSTVFDAEMVLSPIVERDGHSLGIVCNLRDITLRKHMERQLRQTLEQEMELSELKSRYVSMAAHDLRNPLAVIQSAFTLLEHYSDRMSAEQKQERYSAIRDSIKRMIDLLDDILIIGQAESGKLTFNPAPVDVIAFCQSLVEETQQAGGTARFIDFSYQGTCGQAWLDAKLLRHILANLLSNAVKYSPEESTITLVVDCQPDQIVFRVQDQGIGIPEADQARLFEAFHRASNVGHIPGTGLGLAIVKQSVDLHGGAITCESREGAGSTFTVVIPQVPL